MTDFPPVRHQRPMPAEDVITAVDVVNRVNWLLEVRDDYPCLIPGVARHATNHIVAALPVLADRVVGFAIMESPSAPVDVLGALRRLHYDVAGFALSRALPALLKLVGAERLLYGSDYPFTADWVVRGLASALADTDVLTEDQRDSLTSSRAEELFPRWGRR